VVHHGCPFGSTIHALRNVNMLITNEILRQVELAERPTEEFTAQ
jgi:hypothetical protein